MAGPLHEEASKLEEYETNDKDYEALQEQEEELCRQKAESAPLRPRNYNPFAEICNHWSEAAHPLPPLTHPPQAQALLQLNMYDSNSKDLALPHASPASPAVPPLPPTASSTPPASSLDHN
ncbi:hypothetical protein BT96DRAFT_1001109 [Gymnopus androsaceus JB14]|uniref:Uncharacterized protein n=1 Tax=Gymnopus androsaceus JB14 TaxID=1447944 RepID=A0A6A4H2S3_9AGAR|nr:hypothetical protein BT96DRAFT_1001109 [Gymnopus androsaceus JB14]